MFWSGNYIVVRELNFLLKEENVSLSQVLEADDILQECKADNKALIQFLTKPEVLAELIGLITEEPPKNVELASQYRHASIACEVLTSHLSMLSDRLSLDAVQMNRLCDFINKDPPLNPLLASYFSKTVEMLLERSPKQDWYLYHIVCLRVLDFFKSRRDFLPSLLRHLATSAVADTFKYFIRLDDLFNKIIMEWFEEHQFLESLIQIICGTYASEPPATRAEPPLAPAPAPAPGPGRAAELRDQPEKGEQELSEKAHVNHNEEGEGNDEDKVVAANSAATNSQAPEPAGGAAADSAAEAAAEAERSSRILAVASANAAGLLCDLILNGCAGEGSTTRPRTSWVLLSRLQSEEMVRLLLQSMFTSPLPARRHAVVNGCQVLLALLSQDPILAGECEAERTSVELAVAPHLPLLHHALLHDPQQYQRALHEHREGVAPPDGGDVKRSEARQCVGAARVHVAALLAQLAISEVEEVPTTMLTLGTPGALLDMFFEYPHNNFLHAQVYSLVKHALNNRVYRTQYASHLLMECDLLTRLMDVFEENENKKADGSARSGYMGHVILALKRVARALDPGEGELAHQLGLGEALLARWAGFLEHRLRPVLQQHDTPLGGYYPSENIYEVDDMADSMAAGYDFNDMATAALDELAEDVGADDINELSGAAPAGALADGVDDDGEKMACAKSSFLELASQRFDDDMWEDSPDTELGELGELRELRAAPPDALRDALAEVSPWESAGEEQSAAGEGWAQFGGDALGAPADPFAGPPAAAPRRTSTKSGDFDDGQEFTPFWSCTKDGATAEEASTQDLEQRMHSLHLEQSAASQPIEDSTVELANNLLMAMSSMTPEVIANIVNANMPSAPALAPAPVLAPAPAPARDQHNDQGNEQSEKEGASES